MLGTLQIERSLNHIWKWLENSNGQRKVDYLVGTGNYCLRNDVCTISFWRSNLCQKKRKILTFDFEEHNRGMPTSDNQVKKNEKSKKNRT